MAKPEPHFTPPLGNVGVIEPLTGSSPFSLELCLASGQTFAWRHIHEFWIGSIRNMGFGLCQTERGIEYLSSAEAAPTVAVLRHYLALDENHKDILRTFPTDSFLEKSVQFSVGLRVLRQDPWECLAGFILSSTKQIVHIKQIWRNVSERWGTPLRLRRWTDGDGVQPVLHSFPEASQIASLSEANLRACRMGFRAAYLLNAARAVADGRLDLEALRNIPTEEARSQLMELKGVGRKIADCVLLFSLGKGDAFPVDTWIFKVLRRIYFPGKRKIAVMKLLDFVSNHFGPYGGHAQQYLFHYARMHAEEFRPRFSDRILKKSGIRHSDQAPGRSGIKN